jgi:hypothetical protein
MEGDSYQAPDTPKKVHKPLDKDQVDYVLQFIHQEIHPLEDTNLSKALPWLCCCVKNCGKKAEVKEGTDEALL